MTWLYYRLYVNHTHTVAVEDHGTPAGSSPRWGFSPEGKASFVRVERCFAELYRSRRELFSGVLLTHYRETINDVTATEAQGPDDEKGIDLAPGDEVEFIRLRMRTASPDELKRTMRTEVIEPLQDDEPPGLLGYQLIAGYDARSDLGARFGDLDRGVDVTEEVVGILTATAELRFLVNEHPEFSPNHDVIHLYCNSMGLAYPEEIAALEKRVAKMRAYMERA